MWYLFLTIVSLFATESALNQFLSAIAFYFIYYFYLFDYEKYNIYLNNYILK